MTDRYTPRGDRYWAAEDGEHIASAVTSRFDEYQERLREEGRIGVWQIADICYHGRNPDGSYANSHSITFGGEEGEIAKIHIGAFRRHVNGQIGLATSSRPAFEVAAANNDPESVASTQVARQVLDYDLDDGGLEGELVQAQTRAVLYSEGYVVQTWDPHLGDIVGVDELPAESVEDGEPGIVEDGAALEGERPPVAVPVRAGDIRVDVRSPIDVARDMDLDGVSEPPWYIVRTRAHRWELAARYPENADARKAILEAPPATADQWRLHARRGRAQESSGRESDYVHLLTLYHPPTDALPQGRICRVVDGELLPGTDQGYPYDHCVVHRCVPSAELDRSVGYADAWDMLAPQQALDAQMSAILTTQDAASILRWIAPRGQNVDTKQLTRMLEVVEYDDDGMGRPGPMLAPRPEVRSSDIEGAEVWRDWIGRLSGQNDVVQGDPDANIKSGNFAALVASMAVTAINSQVSAYAQLMRSVMSGRLSIYRDFMSEPRLLEVVGRDQSAHVREFTGEALRGARRVRVEVGSALMRALHGKVEIARNMLESYGPEVITPHRFFALMQTGRLDDLDPSDAAKHKIRARKENDRFREGRGQLVEAHIGQHHACHISEHLDEIASLDDQVISGDDQSGQALQAMLGLLDHVTAHAQMWPTVPPEILAATGQDPAPSTLMGGPPGGGGGGGAPPDGPMLPEGGPPLAPDQPQAPMADGQAPIHAAEPAANPLTGVPPIQ